jgi:hypothetical protein
MNATAFRQFVALALALVLALTSVGMAVARAQAKAGTQGELVVTLCSPSGPETVVLGPDGAPVAPPHPCPYCIIMAASDLAPVFAGVIRPLAAGRPAQLGWPVTRAHQPPRAQLPEVRAPPPPCRGDNTGRSQAGPT